MCLQIRSCIHIQDRTLNFYQQRPNLLYSIHRDQKPTKVFVEMYLNVLFRPLNVWTLPRYIELLAHRPYIVILAVGTLGILSIGIKTTLYNIGLLNLAPIIFDCTSKDLSVIVEFSTCFYGWVGGGIHLPFPTKVIL